MKIALSCSGEGRGHASRLIAIAQKLRGKYNLVVWCPDKVKSYIQQELPWISIREIPNFHIITDNYRVGFLKTIFSNIVHLVEKRIIIFRLGRELKSEQIGAVISDYEPFLPRLAKWLHIPVLVINHQLVLEKHPVWGFANIMAIGTNRLVINNYNKRLASSFYNGDVGPIIREEIKRQKTSVGDYFVVYSRGGIAERIQNFIKSNPNIDFRVFPAKDKNFAEELAGCKAVIAPAGHQLISEALYLGKPIFVIPIEGQYEQWLNAVMLERSGWGSFATVDCFEQKLTQFIDTLSSYPRPISDDSVKFNFNDDTDKLISKIEKFIQSKHLRKTFPVLGCITIANNVVSHLSCGADILRS